MIITESDRARDLRLACEENTYLAMICSYRDSENVAYHHKLASYAAEEYAALPDSEKGAWIRH